MSEDQPFNDSVHALADNQSGSQAKRKFTEAVEAKKKCKYENEGQDLENKGHTQHSSCQQEDYDSEINDLFDCPAEDFAFIQSDSHSRGGVTEETCYTNTPPELESDAKCSGVQDERKLSLERTDDMLPLAPSSLPTPPSGITADNQKDDALIAAINVLKMSQNIAEVKSRIISTHTIMTTYSTMKYAYVQVCNLTKSLSSQLVMAKKQIKDLERKNGQLAAQAKTSNAKVEELKRVIQSLPDQGEILRNIAQLEVENIRKAKEIHRLRTICGETNQPIVLD
ncbi:hypothetical protein V1512DRAFT_284075 [Lipomyces arxii]|uniref:uncharacterized protein n=1 Tax=Lipomyces arxii TaxID=56418 RepID=UPI0034CD4DE7